MSEPKPTPRAGSAGLCVKDDTVLLGLSNKINEWVLPGGGIDFGESYKDAVVREMREETSLETRFVRLLDVQEIVKPEKNLHKIVIYSEVAYVSGTPQASDDLSDTRFFTRTELAALVAAGTLTGVSKNLLEQTGWLNPSAKAA